MKEQIAVKIETELKNKIIAAAEKQGERSRASLYREAIEKFCDEVLENGR